MSKARKIKELEKAGAKLPRRSVVRQLTKAILPWLGREEIIVITGARQTGKSVLLYQLIYDQLLPKSENIHYFNLDLPGHREFLSRHEPLIELLSKSKKKAYVIIDEVQRLKEPGLFLKGLYDLHLPLKLVVSGSSALEIKSHVHEALTGRKIVFHLNSFNLEELASALFPQDGLKQILADKNALATVINHFLVYGGYPAVTLAKDPKIKIRLLEELFTSYLEKDIKDFLKIENEIAFRNLLKVLASQIGNLVNKEELSNSLGIHKNTLDNYLFYLEQTFIVDFIRPFFRNRRKELLKNPKIYFRDLGLRNFAIGSFSALSFRPDKGPLFENLSYLCLREALGPFVPIHYWRTKAGAEVDFVIVPNLRPIPFEVKATVLKEFKISRSLRNFLLDYKPKKSFLFNLSLSGKYTAEGADIMFLGPAELLQLRSQELLE